MSYTFGLTPRPFGASAATRPVSAASSIAVPAPMAIPGTPQGFAQDPVFGQQAQTGIGTDAYGLSGGTYGPNGQNIDPRGSGAIDAGAWGGNIGGLFGGPIGSAVGSALGTGIDTALANAAIEASIPGASTIGFGGFLSGVANNMTYGLVGTSIADQLAAALSPGVDLGSYGNPMAGYGALGTSGNPVAEALGNIPGSVLSSSYPDAPPSPYGVLGIDVGYAPVGGYNQSDNGVSSGGYGGTTSGNGSEPTGSDNDQDSDGNNGNSSWWTGGYTGDGAPWEPAGTVHRGEVVLNAPATDYYGADALEALNSQAVPRNALRALMRGR